MVKNNEDDCGSVLVCSEFDKRAIREFVTSAIILRQETVYRLFLLSDK